MKSTPTEGAHGTPTLKGTLTSTTISAQLQHPAYTHLSGQPNGICYFKTSFHMHFFNSHPQLKQLFPTRTCTTKI